MSKELNGLTDEERAIAEATNESKIAANDLLTEIEPLMREYFYGKFELKANGITLSMLNGQKFLLSIKEVV